MSREPAYDIFLSFNQRDRGLAQFVIEALTESGLSVFPIDNLRPGVSVERRIREKLVECSSVIILVTPSSVGTQHLAFEAGMALAWSKTIYVLYDGVSAHEVPEFLRQFHVAPVGDVSSIGSYIAKSRSRIAETDRDTLIRLYAENPIPVDKLILESDSLWELTREFNSQTGTTVSAQRIAQELMNLRKSGRLSAVKSVANSA